MKLSQEAKNMIAMIALVAAVALALNDVAVAGGDRNFLPWSVGLFVVSIFFWLWMRRDALADKRTDAIIAADEAAKQAESLAKRSGAIADAKPAANKTTPAESMAPDNLTMIKGIAESYQQMLYDAGIRTYAELAKMSADDLKAIFHANKRATPVKVETVPRQAELAAEGDWDGLRAYQDTL